MSVCLSTGEWNRKVDGVVQLTYLRVLELKATGVFTLGVLWSSDCTGDDGRVRESGAGCVTKSTRGCAEK